MAVANIDEAMRRIVFLFDSANSIMLQATCRCETGGMGVDQHVISQPKYASAKLARGGWLARARGDKG